MATIPLGTRTQDIAHDERQDYLWTLNFGPQHPATHTTLRIVMKLDGERVVDAMPDIGYLHSGFEKIGESLYYNQYVTVTDRMNYISPMANNVTLHVVRTNNLVRLLFILFCLTQSTQLVSCYAADACTHRCEWHCYHCEWSAY